MSKLLDYLNELDSNPDLKAAHDKDTESSMKAYGLNSEEIAAVMSGDKTQIAKAAGVEDAEAIIKGITARVTDVNQD
ncbi:hypothetical protein [Ferrimonas aestuarii]|uniref:Extradiol ring-cleavage dioxygenase LigAB LigA subunit domain-containing protein n=1 Tax=Ferrimonas aestuarii TaxID=2569539 RepID=A0A4U1BMY5_9GAMM|nr:hypothetical protein [Ferrimonas aestuarii]TKB52794.1 hypothetical protein FCL42_15915 [Ferrimonas aestuarii]